MTIEEFAGIAGFISTAVGKQMTVNQIEVYHDLLADLPTDAVRLGAKMSILEATISVIPLPGVIRRYAVEAMTARTVGAGEAFELARTAIRLFGYLRKAEGLASLTGPVRRAVEQVGWESWCDSDNPEALRAHFNKFYESETKRQQRDALLPPQMKTAIEVSREAARLSSALPKIDF